MLLALKIGLAKIIEEKSGQYPIMLLDDVFSELDNLRKAALIASLPKNMQVFITTSEELSPALFNRPVKFYTVENAKMKEESIMSNPDKTLENQVIEFDELENSATHVNHSYTADDIQVLEGLQAVRMRPGMYIGSTSARGLHHLVWEIVDNGIDEALAGFASEIDVVIEKGDIISVTDNGRGMPVGIHEKPEFPQLKPL